MADENKPSFLDRLKNAVEGIATGDAKPAGGPPQPPRPKTPDTKRGVDGFSRTTDIGRAKQTGGLTAAKSTAQLPEKPAGPPEEELSPRRLAMIEDYMKGDFKLEKMKDPAFMYKVVSDERAYQTRVLFELRKQLQAFPNGGPKADELNAKIKRAQAITTNLFKVLKRITGSSGSTGGTDFLSDNK